MNGLTHMQKYMMFLDRLKQLNTNGKNKGQEANGIKDEMVELWWQMMEWEQKEMERYAASLNNKIVLSDRDRDNILEHLQNPPLPCPKLRALAKMYKKLIKGGQLTSTIDKAVYLEKDKK